MPVTRNGEVEIVYERYGSGDPVLLVMGLGGTKEQWFPQIEGLQDRFTLMVFDNRGVGETGVPATQWTMADMADDAMAVLDAEGFDSAHVVGVSMGGMISQHVALNHPDRVRRLALCATTPGMHYAAPKPEILSLMTQTKGKSVEQIARDNLRLLFTPETIEREKELMEKVVELGIKYAPRGRGFRGQIQAVMGHDTKARLGEIGHETLVFTGNRDELVPMKNSEIIAAGIPGAKLAVLDDTAHGFLMDRADEANRILAEFLAG